MKERHPKGFAYTTPMAVPYAPETAPRGRALVAQAVASEKGFPSQAK
jgi:hypothetical protein